MCAYKDIEKLTLSNGKTVNEVNSDVKHEIESIYRECWAKGVSVPFWDNDGNLYLANPDGSEDRVNLELKTRTYNILSRTAEIGKGHYAYLTKESLPPYIERLI